MMKHLLILIIRAYRYGFSGWKAVPSCRFMPTCSAYALEAVTLHGPWRGGRLALRRMIRCHPWGGYGHDPVPMALTSAHASSRCTHPSSAT